MLNYVTALLHRQLRPTHTNMYIKCTFQFMMISELTDLISEMKSS